MAASGTRELRTGVRRGHQSALDALLYQCADGMYAIALSGVPDEAAAQEVVREAWLRVLWALRGARFDADPARRVWRITEQVLAERLGRRTARAARRAATGDGGAVSLEGVGLQRELLEELAALSEQHAEAIRGRWRARRDVFRGAIVALFLVAVAVWAAVFYQRSRVTGDLAALQYQCLRDRIIRQELLTAMREMTFQLDDPTGADKEAAADCERVMLVLEEIANSESLSQVNGLRYVRARVARHHLADFVRSLEETFPEMSETLPRVALALEEVQNLRRIAATLPVLLALALLAGCSSKSERLYRRAEAFFAQGQFQMAADEYQQLVKENPRSPLADDALYKLAYIFAEETDTPGAALVQYRALADNYPASPYADDALVRAMTIQRRTLKDPAAVRATYEELCRRFATRRDLCARGLLEVAWALFETESYERAAEVAVELTGQYSDQAIECAQAALLQARASKRMGEEPAHVQQLYEEIIARYPDTHAAVAAKRELGYDFYEKHEEEQQQQAAEVRRRSRTITGVPAHASQRGEVLQALAALRSALAQRGESRSLDMLIALSGAAFTMAFDPDRPWLARSVIDVKLFESVAEALGFAYNVWSGPSAEQAFESVHQALLQGHPVLVLYGSPRRWVLVTGYDMAEDRVYFMPPDRGDYAAASKSSFLANWAEASGSGSGVAGAESFYQFSLGARMTRPDEAALMATSVQRAARVMRATSLSGAPAGEEAWQALGAHLEECVLPEATDRRDQASRWIEDGLLPWLSVAEAGTAMLRGAAEVVEGVDDAAERHAELLAEARLVAQKIDEAQAAGDEAAPKWAAAAAQANYVAALHARLARQLADASDG